MRILPRWLIAATRSFLRDGGQSPLEKMMQDTGVDCTLGCTQYHR